MSPIGFPTKDASGATIYMCPCLCHSGSLVHVVPCDCPCSQCGAPTVRGVEHSCSVPQIKRPLEERRAQVLRQWDLAQRSLNAILFQEDPAGLVFEGDLQADEYEMEASEILPRLPACLSEREVQTLIHQKMRLLVDETRPLPIEAFAKVSHRVWLEVMPILREGSIPCSTAL